MLTCNSIRKKNPTVALQFYTPNGNSFEEEGEKVGEQERSWKTCVFTQAQQKEKRTKKCEVTNTTVYEQSSETNPNLGKIYQVITWWCIGSFPPLAVQRLAGTYVTQMGCM